MYLSNTRLISMLFVLAVLTLSLLWLLSKQASLPSPKVLTAEEPLQLAARQPEAEVAKDNAVTGIPDLEPAKETTAPTASISPTPSTVTSTPTAPAEPSKAEKTKPARTTEVATVPESLVLSEKELKALSNKDRKRYEQMLENLRSIRDQSTQLTSEHQRLEQQRLELEQRNQELTKQLEQVRQTTETTAENNIKP